MARVLVIDDDNGIQRLVKAIFNRKTRHEVIAALNGRSGLAIAAAETPDLIMLDLRLPDLDGLEVCRQLKSDPQTSRIPVVMVTGRGSQDDVVKSFQSGANDYIVKPFEYAVLLGKVEKLLLPPLRPEPATA